MIAFYLLLETDLSLLLRKGSRCQVLESLIMIFSLTSIILGKRSDFQDTVGLDLLD